MLFVGMIFSLLGGAPRVMVFRFHQPPTWPSDSSLSLGPSKS